MCEGVCASVCVCVVWVREGKICLYSTWPSLYIIGDVMPGVEYVRV